MIYRVIFTQSFWDDYACAQSHISSVASSVSPAYALEMELDRAIDTVQRYPFAMQPYFEYGVSNDVYRAIDVKSYLAFYVVKEDTVEFRRFLYARSNIPAWLLK